MENKEACMVELLVYLREKYGENNIKVRDHFSFNNVLESRSIDVFTSVSDFKLTNSISFPCMEHIAIIVPDEIWTGKLWYKPGVDKHDPKFDFITIKIQF